MRGAIQLLARGAQPQRLPEWCHKWGSRGGDEAWWHKRPHRCRAWGLALRRPDGALICTARPQIITLEEEQKYLITAQKMVRAKSLSFDLGAASGFQRYVVEDMELQQHRVVRPRRPRPRRARARPARSS